MWPISKRLNNAASRKNTKGAFLHGKSLFVISPISMYKIRDRNILLSCADSGGIDQHNCRIGGVDSIVPVDVTERSGNRLCCRLSRLYCGFGRLCNRLCRHGRLVAVEESEGVRDCDLVVRLISEQVIAVLVVQSLNTSL